MEPSNFNKLNDYDLSTNWGAHAAVKSILEPSPEKKQKMLKQGLREASIVKVQEKVLELEVKKRVDLLAVQKKEIKQVSNSIIAYEKTLSKLDAKISKLMPEAADPNTKAARQLRKLEAEKKRVESYMDGMKEFLIERKNAWKEISSGLNNLSRAVKLSTHEKRTVKILNKLNDLHHKVSSQMKEIHPEKKDWSLLRNIEGKLKYQKMTNILDFATGQVSKVIPLKARDKAELRQDQRKLKEFLKNQDLSPEIRERAAKLKGKIDHLLNSGSYVLNL